MRRDLSFVTLVCPDNDAESRLILLLAYRLGMTVIRSGQGLGATLERERGDLLPLIDAAGGTEVWIVEIPGVDVEKRLSSLGFEVVIIDHHLYGTLDRSRDATGTLLPSSLEQFLTLTGITPYDLTNWGFDPVVVRGVAIMDARFVQGLREEGFTLPEIRRVLDFRRECARAGFPDFDKAEAAAKEAWSKREVVGRYIVVRSDADVPVRGAVCERSIYDNLDTHPILIVDKGGVEIFVQNVDPEVTGRLMSAFADSHVFTFGGGRCWGINNTRGNTQYTLDDIIAVLT